MSMAALLSWQWCLNSSKRGLTCGPAQLHPPDSSTHLLTLIWISSLLMLFTAVKMLCCSTNQDYLARQDFVQSCPIFLILCATVFVLSYGEVGPGGVLLCLRFDMLCVLHTLVVMRCLCESLALFLARWSITFKESTCHVFVPVYFYSYVWVITIVVWILANGSALRFLLSEGTSNNFCFKGF